MFTSVVLDTRYSIRSLRKTPAFTATAAITLALGIGATTAIFSVINALLLNPLPYPDPDRLVVLWQGRSGMGIEKDWLSPAQFLDIRDGSDVFEQLTLCGGASATLTGRGETYEVGYLFAAPSFFEMFGATASLGRVFNERDEPGGEPIVAIVTHALWQTAYGGDPDVVGKTITLNSRDHEIVGVLSPEFRLDHEVIPTVGGRGHLDVLLSPLFAEHQMLEQRGGEHWNVFGKMREGVSIEQVQASMDVVAERSVGLHEEPGNGFFFRAVPLLDEVVGTQARQGIGILMASVVLLLIIACVNVANLLFARSNARSTEMGIRVSVGAGRGRLMRQLLTENMILALCGGAIGLILAAAGVALFKVVGRHSLPRLSEIGVNGEALGFAIALTFATTLAFGILPAMRLSRTDIADVLKRGDRGILGAGFGSSRFNLTSWLVVAEIGLSCLLLVGGGLLTRSMIALQRIDPGFESDRVLTFRYSLRGIPDADAQAHGRLVADIKSAVGSVPGVRSVGSTTVLPFAPGLSWGNVEVEGYVPPEGEDETIIAHSRVVTTDYFETLRIPVLRGRAFREFDRGDVELVAVVCERFAEKVFADQDPIGKRIRGEAGGWARIVGVVPEVKDKSLDAQSSYTVYYPHAQTPLWWGYFVVKGSVEPRSLIVPVRGAVTAVDDRIAVEEPVTMAARVSESLATRRFSMLLLHVFSLSSMVLAAIGVYGLIAYRVGQMRHELGMRMALGAPRRTILKQILGHGMRLACFGVLIGLAVSVAITRLIESMLFGVSVTDGLTYAGIVALILATVFFACLVPARRAIAIDPLEALRAD